MQTSQAFARILLTTAAAFGLSSGLALAADQTARDADQSATPTAAITDTVITAKVKAELAGTQGVDSTRISVTTNNGVVTLTGVVPNDLEVKKAIAVARSIHGVQQVDAAGLKAKG